MIRILPILSLLCLVAACSTSRTEVAQEALTALEREGTDGLLPYLTRDGRRFVETLDLASFVPRSTDAEIRCQEEDCPPEAGWCWVTCVQGERTLKVAVVDTGRGPRIDLFRWSFDPITEASMALGSGGGLP